jgi:uncharacterized protein (TIGR00255 family)
MTASMTGFGSATVVQDGWCCVAELRSVNQRFLDLRLRLPPGFQELEVAFREVIKRTCARGKLECHLRLEREASAPEPQWVLDAALAQQLHETLGQFESQTGRPVSLQLRDLIAVPGLFGQNEVVEFPEFSEALMKQALQEALSALQVMREREGGSLHKDVTDRLGRCEAILEEVERSSQEIPEQYRKRLEENLTQLASGTALPQERILQEIALLADKVDISEELVRFRTHLVHMHELLGQPNSGKRAEFLLQELNREINTIASKSAHAEISRATVEVKSELEKVREQLQNIE